MREESFDVIVIGSGFAGLRAALSARQQGADVLVLEKMRTVGGNSVISDGGMAAAGTSFQKHLGIEDSPSLMAKDILRAGGEGCREELVRIVAEESVKAFAWAKDVLGVPFRKEVELFGGHSVPRSHSPEGLPSGRPYIKRMEERCEEQGVDIRKAHYVKRFLADKDRMSGVECAPSYRFNTPPPETVTRFLAKRGIVVASGGFAADIPYRRLFDKRLDVSIDTTNKASATGEILRAAKDVGAALSGMEDVQLAPWTSPEEAGFGDGPLFADYVALPLGILVGKDSAERFVNELADRRIVAEAILAREEEVVAIADHEALTSINRDIGKALAKHVVRKYPDLAVLAKEEGIPEDELLQTVRRFNKFVGEKNDRDFQKPLTNENRPIATPPFYAMRIRPKTHHTMGGLAIDAKARVLNERGQPIKGLYAAGEACGGIHGISRLGSVAITDCLVFGEIAGKSAAQAA